MWASIVVAQISTITSDESTITSPLFLLEAMRSYCLKAVRLFLSVGSMGFHWVQAGYYYHYTQ